MLAAHSKSSLIVKISRSWCLRSNLTNKEVGMENLQLEMGWGLRELPARHRRCKRHKDALQGRWGWSNKTAAVAISKVGQAQYCAFFYRVKCLCMMNGSEGVSSLPVCEAAGCHHDSLLIKMTSRKWGLGTREREGDSREIGPWAQSFSLASFCFGLEIFKVSCKNWEQS